MSAAQAMGDLDSILIARGIPVAAVKFGWVAENYKGAAGWSYPIFNAAGKPYPARRWKAADSNHHPKCSWLPAKPDGAKYYLLPGILDRIRAAGGLAYLASGEPDVLAYFSAGIETAFCWFDGERSVPSTLVTDLKFMGISTLVYAPDRDDTGIAAATLVRDRLIGSGITLVTVALPGELGSKYDINKAWIDCGFDVAKFKVLLNSCPALELSEPTPVTQRPAEVDFSALYEQWCLEVETEAVQVWNITAPNKEQFSRDNVLCPFHKEDQPSASWNYQTHGLKCFVCGEKNTIAVAEQLGFTSWEEWKKDHLADAPALNLSTLSEPPTMEPGITLVQAGNGNGHKPEESAVRMVTSQQALDQIYNWYDGHSLPTVPILNPYKPLRAAGGMVELMEPRKLIAILGASGTGKTALMETMIDGHSKAGQDVFVWGPEWSPTDYQMRRIARMGGPSYQQQRKHALWLSEEAAGIPVGQRNGEPLTDELRAKNLKIMLDLMTWQGQIYYIEAGNAGVKGMAEMVQQRTTEFRSQGRKVVAWYFDYLQRAKPFGKNSWDILEMIARVIWGTCVDADLVGVLGSQVNKSDSRLLREGTQLDESSGQAVSDQLFNAVITVNPHYNPDTKTRIEVCDLLVVKNSSGPAPVQITVDTELYRHCFTERVHAGGAV